MATTPAISPVPTSCARSTPVRTHRRRHLQWGITRTTPAPSVPPAAASQAAAGHNTHGEVLRPPHSPTPHAHSQQAPPEERWLLPPSAPQPAAAPNHQNHCGAADFHRTLLARGSASSLIPEQAALLLPSFLLSAEQQSPALPASLPQNVRELMEDAKLILKAARAEAGLSARSFAHWVLQSCSMEAAALATSFVQYAHHDVADQAFAGRFSELAAMGLGLSPQHPQVDSSDSSSSTSDSSTWHVGRSRLCYPVFSGSRQPSSTYLESMQAQSTDGNGNGSSNGHAQHSEASSANGESPARSQEEEEAALEAEAEARAALEAAAVAASGARSVSASVEPESPPLATTSTSASRGNVRLKQPLRRPAPAPSPPPEQEAGDAPPSAASDDASSQQLGATPSEQQASSSSASVAEPSPSQVLGSGAVALPDILKRQPTIIQTTPMQLVPLSPAAELRDALTARPLVQPQTQSDSSDSRSESTRGVPLPQVGPWLLTNAPSIFPNAEAVLQPQQQQPLDNDNPAQPRIALRFEHVQQRSSLGEEPLSQQEGSTADTTREALFAGGGDSSEQGGLEVPPSLSSSNSSWGSREGPVDVETALTRALAREDTTVLAPLTLFNNSRTVRSRPQLSVVYVERAVPRRGWGSSMNSMNSLSSMEASMDEEEPAVQRIAVRQGAQGLALRHGDVICVGPGPDAPRFRVEALPSSRRLTPQQATAAMVEDALNRFAPLPPSPPSSSDGSSSRDGGPTASSSSSSQSHRNASGNKGGRGAAASLPPPAAVLASQLQQLSRQARSNPALSCAGYATLMRSNLAGAQANAYAWISWAQAAAAARQPLLARSLFRVALSVAERAFESAVAAAAVAPLQPIKLRGRRGRGNRSGSSLGNSPVSSPTSSPRSSLSGSLDEDDVYRSRRGRGAEAAEPPLDPMVGATMPLVQALFTWGRFEWQTGKLWGSARHLWRMAAYACARHPGGPQAGGVGVILHAWASAELDRDNVRNARVVLAEALRKCPLDQPLYVLAAGVELAGGDPELAKDFCLRAYEMQRSDKHLYLVWPRVMAALREYDKARVLFERGLEYHPRNTKIMTAYAKFETGVGGDPNVARELHRRAMKLDTGSGTDMHNRIAFALLEADAGRLGRARLMLAEGLQRHPRFLPGLLALAKVQRLRGELEGAQNTLRHAATCTHSFDVDLILERAALYRALGEDDIALAEEAHCKAVFQHKKAKQQGASTQQAWMLYEALTQRPEQRRLAKRAFRRRAELGWLSAPGVPGPKGARVNGPSFVPLKRTQVAEARAAAEAAAAAEAEAEMAAAEEAAESARQQAAAEAEKHAGEEGYEINAASSSLNGSEERVDLSSLSVRQRRIRAKAMAQQRFSNARGTEDDDAWEQRRPARGTRSWDGGDRERDDPGEVSDEDVGAPVLPQDMEP